MPVAATFDGADDIDKYSMLMRFVRHTKLDVVDEIDPNVDEIVSNDDYVDEICREVGHRSEEGRFPRRCWTTLMKLFLSMRLVAWRAIAVKRNALHDDVGRCITVNRDASPTR